MADTLKRDLTAIGSFVGLYSFITKISNVNNGGTIAKSGDWAGLPDEEKFTYGRMIERKEIKNKTGAISTIVTTLTGYEVKSTFHQNDAIAQEFDATYAGYECLLLTQLHEFPKKSPSAKKLWLAVFGTVVLSDQKRDSSDGKIEWTFQGMTNAQAIVLTGAPASGKIGYPSVTGFTAPAADITIPAASGTVGIYVMSEQ